MRQNFNSSEGSISTNNFRHRRRPPWSHVLEPFRAQHEPGSTRRDSHMGQLWSSFQAYRNGGKNIYSLQRTKRRDRLRVCRACGRSSSARELLRPAGMLPQPNCSRLLSRAMESVGHAHEGERSFPVLRHCLPGTRSWRGGRLVRRPPVRRVRVRDARLPIVLEKLWTVWRASWCLACRVFGWKGCLRCSRSVAVFDSLGVLLVTGIRRTSCELRTFRCG